MSRFYGSLCINYGDISTDHPQRER